MQAVDTVLTIRALAGLNIGLELDRLESVVERAATDRYIRPEHRSLATPDSKHSIEGAFFARSGLLIAMKAIFAASNEPKRAAFDSHAVGDLALDANEIAFGNPTGTPQDLDDLDVVVQFAAVWDLYNPRFLGYAFARAYRTIELLQGLDPTVVKLRTRLGMSPENLTFDDLPLLDFAAVAFGLFANVHARADTNAAIGDAGFVVDSNTFLSETSVPQDDLVKFLSKRSWTLNQFQKGISGEDPWDCATFAERATAPGFGTDFRVFREHPLMNLGAGQHLILDFEFLAELLGAGVFFQLLSGLDQKQRSTLLDLWGRIFELLVIELFHHFYSPSPSLSIASPFRGDFKVPAADTATEIQIDGMLDLGSSVILFEFKHFLLKQEIKDSLDRYTLEMELRIKLVENERREPKAVRQLANLCSAVRRGTIPTAAGASAPHKRSATLYPVIVVADPAMEAFGMNAFLNEIFQEYIPDIEGEVRPLTVMSIQEVEEVLAHTNAGKFTWEELLDSRFVRGSDGNTAPWRVRLWSIHQAIYDMLAEKNISSVPNEFRRAQFDALARAILFKYSGGGSSRASRNKSPAT